MLVLTESSDGILFSTAFKNVHYSYFVHFIRLQILIVQAFAVRTQGILWDNRPAEQND